MGLASMEDRPKGGKNSPWKQAPEPDNGKPRPPIYNPEDYAASLRKMTSSAKEGSNGTKATMAPQGGEMTLRQFATVTDLLNKLRVDLKLAFPSFVQEFVGDGIEGVTLLLELLRVVQLSQASHSGRPPPPVLRRSLLDEHACLQCLSACLRCQDAARRLASSPAGLFSVAVCIMSSVNKSRLLALELLTKTCEQPEGKGHGPVSDAISTMRLRFGEPVRFRFLVGMMCGACADLLATGLRFINTFCETAPSDQHRFYIQAELEQAGFNTETITKMIPPKSASADLVFTELNRWKKNFINVAELRSKAEKSSKEISTLKEKLALLERKVQILQEEKSVLSSLEKCLKTRCSELEREVAGRQPGTGRRSSKQEGSGSTPGEDEGISSSDQDEGDDLDVEREPLVYEMYTVHNDTIVVDKNTKEEEEEEETTIEEVMEELQNIINDAETDYVAEKDRKNAILKRQALEKEETVLGKHYQRLIGRSSNDLTSEALILEDEADIVPGKLLPQPPRRSRSLFLPDRDNYDHHNMFFEDDESMESSDSLLSTSRDNTVDSEPPHGVFTRSGALRRRETLVIDRRFEATQRDPIRRSETFHHVNKNSPNRNNSHTNLEMNNNLNNRYINGGTNFHRGVNEPNVIRRGSFDGLFYVNEVVERPLISSEPSTKPRGTTIFINKSPDLSCNRKLKSKSLDRIGEGLDSMVDIVVTSNSIDNRRNFVSTSRYSDNSTGYVNGEDGLKTNEEEYSSHIINNKGSAVIIVSRSPSSKQRDSDSKQFLSISTSSSGSCSSGSINKSNVDKSSTNKSGETASNRTSFFPIHRNSTPSDGQKFILKRGHTNAGLYSGQHTDREINSQVNGLQSSRNAIGADYYTRSLNTLQNVNLALSTNKLADLPSGLY